MCVCMILAVIPRWCDQVALNYSSKSMIIFMYSTCFLLIALEVSQAQYKTSHNMHI